MFDPEFSESDRYAELLVSEIPERKRWDTFLAVYQNKEARGRYFKKVALFIEALLKVLTVDQISAVCEVVSEELKTTRGDPSLLKIFQIMPSDLWIRYDEIARIRTESKLIASIKDGRQENGKCIAGALGTWALGIESAFVLKDELVSALTEKVLSSDQEEQDYVFAYFLHQMPNYLPTPGLLLSVPLESGLKRGDKRFHSALSFLNPDRFWGPPPPEGWRNALGAAYDNFSEKQEVNSQVSDDDIPF